ncbi:class II aldolase/adducin family protein [Herbivorax sp. ANBcel31]|uniref:class II aldolase/adducin family protein n=1 Tax=Herbivorax sp. ANBcel31 TaxID=3069754 RepID=UPI0027B38592|nr:class II aldolase/adducin family protein [Herbivorax sp. ANBcel31]MDQ2087123.1 class II aldolase/adducin family protein [Herbivorax sp. ANBcel31]
MSSKTKEHIVEVAKLMYQKGMADAFSGNISVREDDNLYITPSGICKGYLKEEMIVKTDLEGKIIEGNYRPSSEIKLHLTAYKKRKDAGAAIHAHSPYATAFAVANKPIETKAYAEMLIFFGKIPLAKYGAPSTEDICSGAEEYIENYDTILLANHGIMTVEKDVFNAFFKIEAAESIAKVLILSNIAGGEKDLTDEQIRQLSNIRKI